MKPSKTEFVVKVANTRSVPQLLIFGGLQAVRDHQNMFVLSIKEYLQMVVSGGGRHDTNAAECMAKFLQKCGIVTNPDQTLSHCWCFPCWIYPPKEKRYSSGRIVIMTKHSMSDDDITELATPLGLKICRRGVITTVVLEYLETNLEWLPNVMRDLASGEFSRHLVGLWPDVFAPEDILPGEVIYEID